MSTKNCLVPLSTLVTGEFLAVTMSVIGLANRAYNRWGGATCACLARPNELAVAATSLGGRAGIVVLVWIELELDPYGIEGCDDVPTSPSPSVGCSSPLRPSHAWWSCLCRRQARVVLVLRNEYRETPPAWFTAELNCQSTLGIYGSWIEMERGYADWVCLKKLSIERKLSEKSYPPASPWGREKPLPTDPALPPDSWRSDIVMNGVLRRRSVFIERVIAVRSILVICTGCGWWRVLGFYMWWWKIRFCLVGWVLGEVLPVTKDWAWTGLASFGCFHNLKRDSSACARDHFYLSKLD